MSRWKALLTAGLVAVSLATAAPSAAAQPLRYANYGECGSHFLLYRTGNNVRVVGSQLSQLISDQGLVWVSGGGTFYGRFNAYANQNFNVSISTSGYAARQFRVAVTDYDNSYTICASLYTK